MNSSDEKAAYNVDDKYSDMLLAGDEVFGERPMQYIYTDDVDYPKRVKEAINAVSGRALWDETRVISLDDNNLNSPHGAMAAYTESLIPDSVLAQLGLLNFDCALAEYNKKYGKKGGSINGPDTVPAYLPDPRNEMGDNNMVSIRQSMLSELFKTREQVARLSTGEMPIINGKTPSIYRGAVLIHRDFPDVVLAYIDWYESCRKSASERSIENDWYMKNIVDMVERIDLHDPDDREGIVQDLSKTLIFYSICGRTRGAASLLFSRQIPKWMEMEYEHSILWRNGQLKLGLQIGKCKESGRWKLIRGNQPSQGNNDSSRTFFESIGYRDIGSEVSPFLARRNIPAPTEAGGEANIDMFIQSVCMHMRGRFDVAERRCKELNQERFNSYD